MASTATSVSTAENEQIKRMKRIYGQMALGLTLIEEEDPEWARVIAIAEAKDQYLRLKGVTPEQEQSDFFKRFVNWGLSPDELAIMEKLNAEADGRTCSLDNCPDPAHKKSDGLANFGLSSVEGGL
jgi:hypothetical protein